MTDVIAETVPSTDLPGQKKTARGPIQRLSVRFGGSKAKELERFLKFAVVGVIGLIIDLGTTNLLLATVLRPTSPDDVSPERIASSIGFTLAVISNFLLNRYWTYPDSRSRHVALQVVQFFAVNFVGLGIRYVILGLLEPPFGGAIGGILPGANSSVVARLATNGALAVAVAVVMLWNFFVNRYWTYNDVK